LESDPPGFGSLLLDEVNTAIRCNPSVITTHEVDPGSKAEEDRVLGANGIPTWLPYIRSRVLKDAFHVFNMFYLSVAHGLRIEFARALRDAIFIPDAHDKARIVAWGARHDPPQS
jgi:hypothetical protein